MISVRIFYDGPEPTSSFSSLTASAAEERAVEMSTSSTSLDISLKAAFHSSAKGPVELSLAIVPTFFCSCVSFVYVDGLTQTYTSAFN